MKKRNKMLSEKQYSDYIKEVTVKLAKSLDHVINDNFTQDDSLFISPHLPNRRVGGVLPVFVFSIDLCCPAANAASP